VQMPLRMCVMAMIKISVTAPLLSRIALHTS
jgi:hypothetical protein